MSRILAFLFETVEAAQAAVKPLASAGLIARDFGTDTDLGRYGLAAGDGRAGACVLRVQLRDAAALAWRPGRR